MEYKIGDRIEMTEKPYVSGSINIGDRGVITRITDVDYIYGIKFDDGGEDVFHDCRFKKVEDYRQTYVEINNQQEYDKAMLFYEKKGYRISEYKKRHYTGTYYFEWFDGGLFGLKSSNPENGKINITEAVLGKEPLLDKIEIHVDKGGARGDCFSVGTIYDGRVSMQKGIYDVIGTSNGTYNGIKPTQVLIDERIELKNDGESLQPVQKNNPFINLPKKIMNTLRTIMFNELDLKKLAKLIESTEKKLEPINDLIEKLISLRDSTQQEITHMENAVEQQNKKGIEVAKKLIEEQNEILNDKLTEQLIAVGEKLFK